MRRYSLPVAYAATVLMLAGCSADYAHYPSLARRPAERVSGSAEVVPAQPAPQPPAPPSPDLIARLNQLTGQAQDAHRSFVTHTARAEQLVTAAGGAPVASDGWAKASVALADLESSRSQAMIALADLDALYAAERVSGGDGGVIAAARDQVTGLVGEEDAVLAALRGRMAS